MALEGEYLPSTSAYAREQAETFEASGGSAAGEMNGVPIIVLTTIGAKTGGVRKTALMRVEHDGEYAVVASRGGAPTAPAWYWNVRANPRVALQDGAVTREYLARELQGDEYAMWWQRANAVWPHYDEYQEKTDRRIAVFLLEAADAA